MVNDLLLVTVLLFQTQINTSYVSFEEKYVNFSDNMTFSVSMKDSQNHVILDDSDDILVGNMEVNNETIEYSSVIKIPLSGYSNLNINSAYLTLYKKSGYGTTINVKTTNNFELGVTNPFSNFFYINSNNIELTGNYFTINLKEEISNYSSSSDYLYVVFSKASSIGSGVTVFGDSSDGYFAKFAVNTSTFPTISGVGAALPFQPINGISYNGDNTYFCECLNYSIGNYHEIDTADRVISECRVVNLPADDCDPMTLVGTVPNPSNKLYVKAVVDANDLVWGNVRIGQDLNFFLKYLSCCRSVSTISAYIYGWRKVPGSISNSYNFRIFDITESFKATKRFYCLHGKEELYAKYVSAIAYRHYYLQMEKQKYYPDKRMKKAIVVYFSVMLKNVDLSASENAAVYRSDILKCKVKLLLKHFYISKLYAFLDRKYARRK